MDKEIWEILKDLADLCASFEEGLRRFRERVASLALESLAWKTLNAPSPVDPNDRAVKWLVEKCLPEVSRKHPQVKWELIKTEDGKVVGLRYFCEDQETENDIVKPSLWAFEIASSRPLTDSQKPLSGNKV